MFLAPAARFFGGAANVLMKSRRSLVLGETVGVDASEFDRPHDDGIF